MGELSDFVARILGSTPAEETVGFNEFGEYKINQSITVTAALVSDTGDWGGNKNWIITSIRYGGQETLSNPIMVSYV